MSLSRYELIKSDHSDLNSTVKMLPESPTKILLSRAVDRGNWLIDRVDMLEKSVAILKSQYCPKELTLAEKELLDKMSDYS